MKQSSISVFAYKQKNPAFVRGRDSSGINIRGLSGSIESNYVICFLREKNRQNLDYLSLISYTPQYIQKFNIKKTAICKMSVIRRLK